MIDTYILKLHLHYLYNNFQINIKKVFQITTQFLHMFPINKIYHTSVNKISTHLPKGCDADTYPLTLKLWCRYLARLWSRYHPSYLVFRIQILSAHLPLDCDLGHWTWPPPSPASAPDRRRWGWCRASVTSQFPETNPSQPADSHPCWPASLGTPQQGSTNKTQ